MEIKRSGSQPSRPGPADYFTGSVHIDPLIDAPDPARIAAVSVSFEPGARTAWHTHPLGQTLIITAGRGRAQRWGGPIEDLHPGDVVWFPPGEKHWHGAAPTIAMTHIAIQEKLNGKAVDWMEKVSDEQYGLAQGCVGNRTPDRTLDAAAIQLTPTDLRDIETAASKVPVQGARYPERLERMTGR